MAGLGQLPLNGAPLLGYRQLIETSEKASSETARKVSEVPVE